MSNNETKSVFDCMMKEYKDEIIGWSMNYFKKPQKTETVYTPKIFSEAVKTTHFVVLGTMHVVLKATCLLYECLVRTRNIAANSQNVTNIEEHTSTDKVCTECLEKVTSNKN